MRLLFALALSASLTAPLGARAQEPASIEDAAPMSNEALASLASAPDVLIATAQQVTGSVSGASVSADTIRTGDIRIDGGALSEFGGIGSFVLNTGANSTLQSVVSVTVVTGP